MSLPSPIPNQTAGDEQSRWLAAEVLPHEQAVRGYLRSRFPSLDSDDVVQESYLKLLKCKARGKIESSKAYFLTVARNTALVLFRRRRIYSDIPVGDLPDSNILDTKCDASEITHLHQRLDLAVAAIQSLPPRCREVFRMAALEKIPPAEIAVRLGISEKTVYVQIARGVKKCSSYLRERGERP